MEGFGKDGAGTGEGDAEMVLAACAVDGTCVEEDVGFVDETLGELLAADAQATAQGLDTHPSEVGAFEGHDSICFSFYASSNYFWRNVAEFVCQVFVVVVDVGVELVEPLCAFVAVGSDGGDGTEGVDVAHFVDVDGAVDATASFGVVAHDVGHLQPGNVERLAG